MTKLAKYIKGLNILTVVVSEPLKNSAEKLQTAPQHIVIGTPARVERMIEMGYLDVSNLKLLILDGTDEMLSQGFLSDIISIHDNLPRSVQTVLFRFVICIFKYFLFFLHFQQ